MSTFFSVSESYLHTCSHFPFLPASLLHPPPHIAGTIVLVINLIGMIVYSLLTVKVGF